MALGGMLVVGAPGESSCASGGELTDGASATDTDCPNSGAVYTFWPPLLNDFLVEQAGFNPDIADKGCAYTGLGYTLDGKNIGPSAYGYSSTNFTAQPSPGTIVGGPTANDNAGLVLP